MLNNNEIYNLLINSLIKIEEGLNPKIITAPRGLKHGKIK